MAWAVTRDLLLLALPTLPLRPLGHSASFAVYSNIRRTAGLV